MIGLTVRQREVLDYIRAYLDEKSFSPSVGEIAVYFSISPPSALMHLRALQKKKLIKRTSRARSIVLIKPESSTVSPNKLFSAIPLCQTPEVLRTESPRPTVFISPDLINSESFQQLFAYRAECGNKTGILLGDILVVRRQSVAADGEQLLISNGEVFRTAICSKKEKRIRFLTETPLPDEESWEIAGRIIALQRHL